MKHEESAIKVYYTRHYEWFRFITGNRHLDIPKVKRIIRDIADGLDVLRYCPIMVIENGEFLEVDDGQNRLEVCKRINSPVWYILAEDLSIDDIIKINSNTEKWKTSDHIISNIDRENKNYIILRNFMKETSFPLSASQRLLSRGMIEADSGQSKGDSLKFKRGNFVVAEQDKAEKFAQAVKLFKDFPYHTGRQFLLAVEMVIKNKKCDYYELVEKYKSNPGVLQKQESVKAYLTNLETIYNHRMRDRRVIY